MKGSRKGEKEKKNAESRKREIDGEEVGSRSLKSKREGNRI